jgi:hypothetical protein
MPRNFFLITVNALEGTSLHGNKNGYGEMPGFHFSNITNPLNLFPVKFNVCTVLSGKPLQAFRAQTAIVLIADFA